MIIKPPLCLVFDTVNPTSLKKCTELFIYWTTDGGGVKAAVSTSCKIWSRPGRIVGTQTTLWSHHVRLYLKICLHIVWRSKADSVEPINRIAPRNRNMDMHNIVERTHTELFNHLLRHPSPHEGENWGRPGGTCTTLWSDTSYAAGTLKTPSTHGIEADWAKQISCIAAPKHKTWTRIQDCRGTTSPTVAHLTTGIIRGMFFFPFTTKHLEARQPPPAPPLSILFPVSPCKPIPVSSGLLMSSTSTQSPDKINTPRQISWKESVMAFRG